MAHSTAASTADADTLAAHLARYGIRRFDDLDHYAAWMEARLGGAGFKRLEDVRRPMHKARISKEELLAFYDYIADPEIAAVMHSYKADAIRASGAFADLQLSGPAILDLGCNIGYLTTWYALRHPAATVMGIDLSPASISTAQRFAGALGLVNVRFQQVDGDTFDHAERYDQIVDTQGALANPRSYRAIARVLGWLKPGATLVCVPVLGNTRQHAAFLKRVARAGGAVIAAGFITFTDRGEPSGYPTFVLARAAEAAALPPEHLQAVYQSLLATVAEAWYALQDC